MEESHCFWTKWSLLVSSQTRISLEMNTLTICLLGFVLVRKGLSVVFCCREESKPLWVADNCGWVCN